MVYNETFDSEFYNSLALFKMNMQIPLAAGSEGTRKSNAKGTGVEFSDFREYIPGDDIRRVDWNAYARFDRLFVKLFMEEKEGLFRIYLDSSASMDYGVTKKSRLALQFAAAFSYLILDNNDRVTLGIMSNNTLSLEKSVSGIRSFSKIIDSLSRVTFAGENDLYSSISGKDILHPGITIVISDFFSKDIEKTIKYLKQKKQEIIFIHTLAEEELNPVIPGTFNLVDSENHLSLKVTGSNGLLKKYDKSLNTYLTNTKNLCKKYGVKYIFANTKNSFINTLRG